MARKVAVIAECAQGYEGNYALARLLVRAAAGAGADIVKFQMVYADDLATPDYVHYDLFRSLELSADEWGELAGYAKELNLRVCFDVFGPMSLEVIRKMEVDMIKIHPTDINNMAILDAVNKGTYQILLGIGGASLGEIRFALERLSNAQCVVLVLGYQAYPTLNKDNQIIRIVYLKDKLSDFRNIEFGFADHVVADRNISITLNAMAYVAGAGYFEKHLSLGNVVKLEDHESSLQPDDFAFYVKGIKDAVEAYGDVSPLDYFGMSESEQVYRKSTRRKWVTNRPLARGHVIGGSDLAFKRCGNMERPSLGFEELVGHALKRSVGKHETLTDSDIHA